MRLLSRYVVREHVGPLLFALAALTSLLMLQYVARQLANLAGKGLPWAAIGKFFVLSLPFTIAMTLPMAVLVATLYAFGRMAAEHEITAFKASGVRVRALMAPVLVCALLLSLGMVWFNDQVLPLANHKLRILQQDIARTKPTLALRDQTLNQLTETFFMRVARSDAESNRMWDVTIYDLSKSPERKTIYADSGLFSTAKNGDLQLQLFDGFVQELPKGDARRLQRTHFRTQTVRVKDVAQGFQSSAADNYKGDREMSVCEMQRKYVVSSVEYERVRQEYISQLKSTMTSGQTATVPGPRPRRVALAHLYCNTLPSLIGVKTAKAQGAPVGVIAALAQQQLPPQAAQPGQPPTTQDSIQRVREAERLRAEEALRLKALEAARAHAAREAASQSVAPGVVQQVLPQPGSQPQPVPGQPNPQPVIQPDPSAVLPGAVSQFGAATLSAGAMVADARETLDSLDVEIQKKFALSFACLVFVLFGPPIALRFPRGGVGVTLGVSIIVFGLYYICLMGGEALADKGRLPPPVAMWIANVVFALVGIALLWRVESTTDTSRGGGLRDWWVDRKARRSLAREMAAEKAGAQAAGLAA